MKGFIELTILNARLLVAVNSIVGVVDRKERGCLISLNSSIYVSTLLEVLDCKQTYDEVLSLIEKAQQA